VEADTPPASQRLLSKLRTRQKVMAAARTLFSQHGYEAATIRDIARAAGMSTGAVFANFQDKADLFEAVMAEDFDRVADVMRAAAEATDGQPVADRLAIMFAAAYRDGFTDVPLVQAAVAQSWVHARSAEVRGRNRAKITTGLIGDLLRQAVTAGELRADFDLKLISEMLWDGFIGNYRRGAFDGWTTEQQMTRLSDQIAVLLAGIRQR
jgi:AcrR family transcriptional regulator